MPHPDESPLVSVLIPVYGVELYLAQCVESVLAQSLADLEVILVDDGSPDSCPQMADDFASRDSRVKVIHQANQGSSAARNAGLRLATGRYVMFLDSDDYLAGQDVLAECLSSLSSLPEVDVLFTDHVRLYERTQTPLIDSMDWGFNRDVSVSSADALRHMIAVGDVRPAVWAKIIRRQFLVDNELYFRPDMISAEDIEWFLRLIPHAARFSHTQVASCIHREDRLGSITNTIGLRNVRDVLDTALGSARQMLGTSATATFKHDYLAYCCYLFTMALALYSGLDRADRTTLQPRIREAQFLLTYDSYRSSRWIALLCRLVGVEATARLLHSFLVLRQNKANREQLDADGRVGRAFRVETERQVVRVLHVCGDLAGGVATVLLSYYRHIDRTKVQFDFLTHMEPEASVRDEVESLGGNITVITPKSTSLRQNLRETRRYINRNTPHHVVHVHTASPTSFVYLAAAQLAGKRVRIAHSHLTSLDGPEDSLQRRLHGILRPVLRWYVTDMFACSRAAGEWLYGVSARTSLRVLPNAIDVEQFRFSEEIRQRIRRGLGIEDQLVIGHVGRFAEQKNHRFLIEFFADLARVESAAVLLLVGDGPLTDDVESQVVAAGLEERVQFLGLRDDVPALLQAMDLFVLPSLYEGLPLVLVEAQASGLPCLASSSITDEVRLTGLLEFLDLADGPRAWASRALDVANRHERRADVKLIAEAGYDIRSAAGHLGEFYLDRVGARGRRNR